MRPAAPLLEAAREAQTALADSGSAFILIGGLAVFRWGEPRITRDVDFTVLCALGDEDAKVDAILRRLRGRIDDAAEFARRSRVLLATASNGVPIDIALGALPYEERAVERGSDFAFAPGLLLRTCSAEDLVVMKAFAGRDHDLLAIDGVVARQGELLDWELIEKELAPMLELKGDQETWKRLVALRRRS
jgi:hypothetical protein